MFRFDWSSYFVRCINSVFTKMRIQILYVKTQVVQRKSFKSWIKSWIYTHRYQTIQLRSKQIRSTEKQSLDHKTFLRNPAANIFSKISARLSHISAEHPAAQQRTTWSSSRAWAWIRGSHWQVPRRQREGTHAGTEGGFVLLIVSLIR